MTRPTAIAGRAGADDVTGVTPDLLRANDSAAYDTSVARLGLRDAPTLTTAVTLCAADRGVDWAQ